jgi:hypothetical protein
MLASCGMGNTKGGNMKGIWYIVLTALLAGCTHKPPVRPAKIDNTVMLSLGYDDAWSRSLKVLANKGFKVVLADKKAGTISTSVTQVKLDENEADCGKRQGVPYLGDRRTVTSVAYTLLVKSLDEKQTGITVSAYVGGEFKPADSGGTKRLTCESWGYLEKDLIDDLK